jgi:hypothetical protein
MSNQDNFTPAIGGLDQFDQSAEIARLTEFVRRICTDEGRRDNWRAYCVARGVAKFVQSDLLGYGAVILSHGVRQGFGMVRPSNTIDDFIQRAIDPADYTCGLLLRLLADGCLLFETTERSGTSDFVWSTTGRPMQSAEPVNDPSHLDLRQPSGAIN